MATEKQQKTEKAIAALENLQKVLADAGTGSAEIKAETVAQLKDAAETALSSLRHQQEELKNDPLTLEELAQMEGEPVWIANLRYPGEGHWDIVGSGYIKEKQFNPEIGFCCSIYDAESLAYRHIPEVSELPSLR